MTIRERVFASICHKQPDRIPYHISFTQQARAKMAEYYDDPYFETRLGNCLAYKVGSTHEWLRPLAPDAWQEVRPNVWRDEFGVEWDRTIDKDIGTVVNTLVTPDNIDDFLWPNPRDSARYTDFPKSTTKRDIFIVAFKGWSLYERAWTLVGMENLLMAMVSNKSFAHKLFDKLLEFNLGLIDQMGEYDIDAVRFGDDWGDQRGVMMGLKLWREFIKPRLAEMFRAIKARGKYVFLHSCGKVQQLFPELVELGLDVFNPFQPEVMDVYEMKRLHGDRLCFYGGISTQKTLPFGTPGQTREETQRLIELVGTGGGLIAAPAHDIPADAKPENIAAMIEVLQNQY